MAAISKILVHLLILAMAVQAVPWESGARQLLQDSSSGPSSAPTTAPTTTAPTTTGAPNTPGAPEPTSSPGTTDAPTTTTAAPTSNAPAPTTTEAPGPTTAVPTTTSAPGPAEAPAPMIEVIINNTDISINIYITQVTTTIINQYFVGQTINNIFYQNIYNAVKNSIASPGTPVTLPGSSVSVTASATATGTVNQVTAFANGQAATVGLVAPGLMSIPTCSNHPQCVFDPQAVKAAKALLDQLTSCALAA